MLRALTALALTGSLLAAPAAPAPGEVMVTEIDGLRVLDEQLDLDFERYRQWSPELVDHVDPTAEVTGMMRGAYRIWGGDDIDGVILNVTSWPDIDDAARYVDRAAREAAALGLRTTPNPFGDVLRFDGRRDDGAFYTYLTWRHETYGVAMVAVGGELADDVVESAREQQAALEVATGTGDGSLPPVDSSGSDDVPTVTAIVNLVVLVLVFGLLGWSFVRFRRSMRSHRFRPDPAEQPAEQPDDQTPEPGVGGA